MAGQVKKDREWATRTDAIKHLAERPNMSAAEAFGLLFNSEPTTLMAAAKSLQAGIATRKRLEVERLRKELAEHDAASAGVTAAAKAAAIDARLDAENDKLSARLDAIDTMDDEDDDEDVEDVA